MHIGTMVEFAFALVAKLDVINKHSFNDFKLRVGMYYRIWEYGGVGECSVMFKQIKALLELTDRAREVDSITLLKGSVSGFASEHSCCCGKKCFKAGTQKKQYH